MTFTFLTITYNHEKYIREHLSSIRYQIKTYGDGIRVHFIMCDDASKDHTVSIARDWLAENADLFEKVTILDAKQNAGTIRNLKKGIDILETDYFKLLAGDDMYGRYDVFHVLGKYDMVISQGMSFDEEGHVITGEKYWDFMRVLTKGKKHLHKKLRRLYSYNQFLCAPAIFLSVEKMKNEKLWDFLLQYQYVEDVPMWYFFFTREEQELSIGVCTETYILYRKTSGISTNKKHKKHSIYDEEVAKQRKDVGFKKYRYTYKRNPYVYLRAIQSWKLSYWDRYVCKAVKQYKSRQAQEEQENQNYLNEIYGEDDKCR